MLIGPFNPTLQNPGYEVPGLPMFDTPSFSNAFQFRTATFVIIMTDRTDLLSASFCLAGSSGTM